MTDLALIGGIALGGVLVALLGTDALLRRRELGVWLVLGAVGLRAVADGVLPGVTLGGISVYVGDLILGLFAVVVVARLLRGWRLRALHRAVLLLAGLVAFSLLRGFGVFDLPAVLNEARDTLYFLAVVLYFAPAPTAELRAAAVRAWTVLAAFLVALAVLRWAAVFGGLPYAGNWRDQAAYGGLRVLWSDETLVLGQAVLILLPAWLDGTLSRAGRRVALAAAAAVALLQHRSVWVCLSIGLVAVVAQQASVRQRAGFRLAAALVVTAGLVALVAPGDRRQQELVLDAEFSSSETFEWRVEGWARLIDQRGPDGPLEVAAGVPYGTGYRRDLGPYTTDTPPHNYYVESYLRIGLAGVLVLLLLYGRTMTLLARTSGRTAGPLNDRTLLALLAVQLVYYVPYWPRLEQGLLLGLAIGAANAVRAQPGARMPARASTPVTSRRSEASGP